MRQDLAHAVRALLRAPSFAVTAILTLALATAVNTIVFTLLNSLALRSMPVRDPESVVRIFPMDADGRRQNLFSDVLALWILPSRVAAVAGSVFGAIAAVGIYGVMAYGIVQRRREIAVRVALGATGHDVRSLLLADGGRLIATGLIAGVLGAIVMMRAIASVLPGAIAADPVALGMALAVLTVAAVCACYIPARSASEWDPLPALRSE